MRRLTLTTLVIAVLLAAACLLIELAVIRFFGVLVAVATPSVLVDATVTTRRPRL